MRAWIVPLAITATVAAADPPSVMAATVAGQVVRPPAAARQPVNVNRYRERAPARDKTSEDTVTSCGCRPGEFAVVHLTSEGGLPAATMPLEPPVMAQKDRSFVPSVLAIPVGGSVDFPNMDPYFHNVFPPSRAARRSGESDQTYTPKRMK